MKKEINFFLPEVECTETPKVNFYAIALKVADKCNHEKKIFRIPQEAVGKSHFVCLKCAQDYADQVYTEHIIMREKRKKLYGSRLSSRT